MIDPISAFALIKTAHSTLMTGIKMSKDFSQMGGAIAKFAQGEAVLGAAKEKKKKSLYTLHLKAVKAADIVIVVNLFSL